MSDYRDDTTESAIASSSTWGGYATITEALARARTELAHGLGMSFADTAAVSVAVFDFAGGVTEESATLEAEVIEALHATGIVEESIRIKTATRHLVRALHYEAAIAGDELVDSIMSVVAEHATAADTIVATRRAITLVHDSAVASATTFAVVRDLAQCAAGAADAVHDKSRARVLVIDSTAVNAEAVEVAAVTSSIALDAAQVLDGVQDLLHARQIVIEAGELLAEAVHVGLEVGQAWTATAKTWATSRYEPFAFHSPVVIGGVLHVAAQDGVYAIDGDTETIEATLESGLMDLGGGALVHPLGAYMEYEISGTANLDVTQTQSGAAQTYRYALSGRQADAMTSGRFVFGRGLRGRRFAFSLHISGQRAEINDLSIDVAQTKRRM